MHPIERLRAVARAQGVDQAVLAREAALVLAHLSEDPPGLVTACRRLLDRHPAAGVLWWTCARLLEATDAAAEALRIGRDLDDDRSLSGLALDLPDQTTVCIVAGDDAVDELADNGPGLRLIVTGRCRRSDPGGRGRFSGDWPVDEAIVVVDSPGAAVLGSDLVVIEALAIGRDDIVVRAGSAEAIAAGEAAGVPIWVVVGVGRRLSPALFDAMVRRLQQTRRSEGLRPPYGPDRLVGRAEPPDHEIVPRSVAVRLIEPRTLPCPSPPELLRTLTG